jgi:hypothetical protein
MAEDFKVITHVGHRQGMRTEAEPRASCGRVGWGRTDENP